MAIVGARRPTAEADAFAKELAGDLARAGAVVASGGARGIDRSAHVGTLDAGGRTWVVAGTGCQHCFPGDHGDLFAAIAAGPGAMLWPFPPETRASGMHFRARNRILAALCDAFVVVQAGAKSGALHSAMCARRLGKPLWVVATPPWLKVARDEAGFEGSHHLLETGARPLTSKGRLMESLGLPSPARQKSTSATSEPDVTQLSLEESSILAAVSPLPLHLDEIAARARSSAQATAAALLTLALENVVVEGPPGFFRRRDAPNR